MDTSSAKIVFLFFFAVITGFHSFSQTDNPKYDKAMADSLGGDDYGMKKYVLVILKTGSRTETNKTIVDSLFRGHMDNINRLVTSGKLVIAGPLVKNEKNYRGIFILNVPSIEEARKLVDMDPAIREKLLDVDMFQWYGSAAISEYLKAHEKIEKKKF
jgi:uncharacterized protein YciI